jgi:acetylornithine deacetylase/succinyl-diaminopimelate desuccinylase-like protein
MTTDGPASSPSKASPPSSEAPSETELAELVELLRDLIRIPSVNPPGDEVLAARYLEQVLVAEGLRPTVVEPFPGRGSIVCRVHGDGSGGDPLLLLSHLDVVPADPAGWSHDPFAADVADGFVFGRGAIDMKSMVAMEVQVMRRLARAARAAGRDPASDPVPGLGRDVIFCSSADEEAGGWQGACWLVDQHPEWLRAAAALNEAGAMATTVGGVRFYPIQTAEKGFVTYKLHVRGRSGHGSIPLPDNAAVLAAQVVTRLADQGPARLTDAVRGLVERAAPHLPAASAAALTSLVADPGAVDPARLEATLARLCDPVLARTVVAVLHDTVSVGILRAGLKYNVIPGTAEIEADCRTLPGTTEPDMRAELRRRVGEELWSRLEVECEQVGPPAEAPLDGPLYPLLEQVVGDHDPDGVSLPFLAPYATDAKHLARLGVPCYGFSPLRLGPGDVFLAELHNVDERVAVDALAWGLPTLWDAVRRFCG